MTRGAVAIGETFGDLTVGRMLGHNHRREQLWLCRCSCGGAAIRSTGALRGSVRRRSAPCCRRCHVELWGGVVIERRREHAAAWLGLWDRYGTLWSQATFDRIGRDIREKVGAEMGGWDERPRLPVETVEAAEGTSADWQSGRGDDEKDPTLTEIGTLFGVCRERARGIILQALAAFAKAWAAMFPRDPLAWLLYDENDRLTPPIVRMVQIDAAIAATKRAA